MEDSIWSRFSEAKELINSLRQEGMNDEQIIEHITSWDIDRDNPKLRQYILCQRFFIDCEWAKKLLN